MTLKKCIDEENIKQDFSLKKVNETRNVFFVEAILIMSFLREQFW